MARHPIILFGSIRKTTLTFWLEKTERELKILGTPVSRIVIDDYSGGLFECQWQHQARTITNDTHWHVSHFCSLGDWASNITDMLTDARYDDLPFDFGAYGQILFRYYTRFLLVVSELIDDFAGLLTLMEGETSKKDRRQDLSNILDGNKLSGFINSVCKHKAAPNQETKFHYCNHHLPIFFEDSGEICTFNNAITKIKFDISEPDGVVMPRLSDLVVLVMGGYQLINEVIQHESEPFEKFILKYGKSLS
jgi:hypothetical protein